MHCRPTHNWRGMCMSANGQTIVSLASNSPVYTSSDGGQRLPCIVLRASVMVMAGCALSWWAQLLVPPTPPMPYTSSGGGLPTNSATLLGAAWLL